METSGEADAQMVEFVEEQKSDVLEFMKPEKFPDFP